MRLVKIKYSQVLADLEQRQPTDFNTSFHTAEEAPNLERPSEEPYLFKRWLSLILRSRGLSGESAQIITFSRAQTRLLLDAAEGSIQIGTVNRIYAEDIEEEILPKLSSLEMPPTGLFMRLNACSAKDGVTSKPGQSSLHSPEEIILLLMTSLRARNALSNCLERNGQFELFFLPFDERMQSENEYRVFCPPGGENISGISQYQWHKPWKYANRMDAVPIAATIAACCQTIKLQILQELQQTSKLDNLLRQQGFSFDVLFDEERSTCELVELNVFGVRSACGSCLFQWVEDREILYGNVPSKAQFRVTM
ncbi:hypothetical protein SCUP515_04470 [Seiridium cupressi]